MDNKKNIQDILDTLESELDSCNESISRVKEEINAKRRNLAELQTKQKNIREKIKAKRYEALENLVSDKLEMSIDELTGAVKSGGVLVEKAKSEDSASAAIGNIKNKEGDT